MPGSSFPGMDVTWRSSGHLSEFGGHWGLEKKQCWLGGECFLWFYASCMSCVL